MSTNNSQPARTDNAPLGLSSNRIAFTVVLLVLTVVTRGIFLFSPAGRSGGPDEAIFGLMAQNIQHMEEFPAFCWQAHYAGAAVSYLGALFFHFFGSGFLQLRLAMFLVAIMSTICWYSIYRRLFGATRAFVATLFLVFCPYLFLRYSMAPIGGYGETMLGAALIIILSWRLVERADTSDCLPAFVLGSTCGFFFYILFLVAPAIAAFALPAAWRAGRRQPRVILAFILGSLVGALPLIVYNLSHGGATVLRSAGQALSVGRDDVAVPAGTLVMGILVNKIAFLKEWFASSPYLLGHFVMPGTVDNAVLIEGGVFLIILTAVFLIYAFRLHDNTSPELPHLRQFAFFMLFTVALAWAGNLNRSRHLMPLLAAIPIVFLGIGNVRVFLRIPMNIALILVSVIQLAAWPSQLRQAMYDARPVAAFLVEHNLTEFYGTYSTTYPVVFAANGKIVGSPSLLFENDIFSDRRPDWTRQVEKSSSPAFVFSPEERQLENKLQGFLTANNIEAEVSEVELARIYHHLSRPVGVHVVNSKQTVFTVE